MERTLLVWVGHQSAARTDTKSIISFSTDYIYFRQMLHGHYTATDDIWTLKPHDPLDPVGPWEDLGVFQGLVWLWNFCFSWKGNIVVTQASLKEMRQFLFCIAKQLFPVFNFNSLGSTASMLMFVFLINNVICKVYNVKHTHLVIFLTARELILPLRTSLLPRSRSKTSRPKPWKALLVGANRV